ncbi:protein kinase [Achlya hypogyna]|uniref:Protein kinase n=1 Tax=Achlya hypogyna TaxID=1202772 RepID=A0A1V9YR33_ACHHY|nr:protein kinase [Achlya hypogyna]
MGEWVESADYVARFRSLQARAVAATAPKPTALPPATVVARLAGFDLTWDVLPPLLQQAVLWDMGLVVAKISGTDAYVQVYTACNQTMASIGLTMAEFTTPDPIIQTTTPCTPMGNGTNTTVLRQFKTDGTKLDNVIKCAIELVDAPDPQSSLLAQDALGADDIPAPRVWRHHDPGAGWTKLAIHTLPAKYAPEPAWGSCPVGPSARIIPCEARNQRLSSPNACLPQPSAAMTSWLASFKTTLPPASSSGLSTANIVLIAVLSGVVVFAAVFFCICRRRRAVASPKDIGADDGTEDPSSQHYVDAATPPTPAPHPAFERSASTVEVALRELYRDPSIQSKQLVYKDLDWIRILAAGAFGEVYLGQYHNKRIALKRIQAIRLEVEGVVEAFAEEIRLMAHFRHPNIVAFVGFAWDLESPATLCAVTEYLPEGDLKAYLVAHPVLPWSTKMVFALDVARALQYLHELLEPTIIHRDLKSKNILLALPHAKLSDFGISREQINDDTLTAGVGTAFYSAPEVMKGLKYTKQADVYSFGCVLAEMDTHKSLYHEWKFPAIAILNKVMHEGLRPALTPTCPAAIRALAHQCFHADPNERPTASDIARDLADLVGKGRIERHAWKSQEST